MFYGPLLVHQTEYVFCNFDIGQKEIFKSKICSADSDIKDER